MLARSVKTELAPDPKNGRFPNVPMRVFEKAKQLLLPKETNPVVGI